MSHMSSNAGRLESMEEKGEIDHSARKRDVELEPYVAVSASLSGGTRISSLPAFTTGPLKYIDARSRG